MGKRVRIGSDIPYEVRLSVGDAFAHQAIRWMTEQRFPMGYCWSYENQLVFGDTLARTEIKNDRRWMDTGNLFIEVRERPNDKALWLPAGIYHRTEPWFYLIGDETCLWFLPVRWLQRMHQTGKFQRKQTPTAEAFLLPVEMADKIALKVWKGWLSETNGGG
jgi:hypothetical protein